MEFPWSNKEEIENLKEKVEKLEKEKKNLRKRFEAEKERRSKLSKEKQEAEEQMNRLEDKLESLKDQEQEEEKEQKFESTSLSFDDAYRILEKIDSIRSPEKDLVKVQSPDKVRKLEDFKALKNTVDAQQLAFLQSQQTFVGFLDQDFLNLILKTRPFFEQDWSLDTNFDVSSILDFIQKEKVWVLTSAGETRIFREYSGDFEEIKVVKSRVDREHSKGGFSQGRFERKRKEQIQEHLKQVQEVLEDFENVYILGPKEICENLQGEYLGGYDPNMAKPEVFYSFQMVS